MQPTAVAPLAHVADLHVQFGHGADQPPNGRVLDATLHVQSAVQPARIYVLFGQFYAHVAADSARRSAPRHMRESVLSPPCVRGSLIAACPADSFRLGSQSPASWPLH